MYKGRSIAVRPRDLGSAVLRWEINDGGVRRKEQRRSTADKGDAGALYWSGGSRREVGGGGRKETKGVVTKS